VVERLRDSLCKSAARRDQSREWGRLKAIVEPMLTLGNGGKLGRFQGDFPPEFVPESLKWTGYTSWYNFRFTSWYNFRFLEKNLLEIGQVSPQPLYKLSMLRLGVRYFKVWSQNYMHHPSWSSTVHHFSNMTLPCFILNPRTFHHFSLNSRTLPHFSSTQVL